MLFFTRFYTSDRVKEWKKTIERKKTGNNDTTSMRKGEREKKHTLPYFITETKQERRDHDNDDKKIN